MKKPAMLLAAILWATALNAQTDRSMKKDMTLITIEEHFTDPRLAEADAKWRPKTELTDEQPSDFHDFLMRSSLTDGQKQLIAHKNAERLYHLK